MLPHSFVPSLTRLDAIARPFPWGCVSWGLENRNRRQADADFPPIVLIISRSGAFYRHFLERSIVTKHNICDWSVELWLQGRPLYKVDIYRYAWRSSSTKAICTPSLKVERERKGNERHGASSTQTLSVYERLPHVRLLNNDRPSSVRTNHSWRTIPSLPGTLLMPLSWRRNLSNTAHIT